MKNCVYLFNPEEVKNIFADVATRELSEEGIEEFKNEIRHQETTDLDKIADCSDEKYCMKYYDTSDWYPLVFGRVIYRRL